MSAATTQEGWLGSPLGGGCLGASRMIPQDGAEEGADEGDGGGEGSPSWPQQEEPLHQLGSPTWRVGGAWSEEAADGEHLGDVTWGVSGSGTPKWRCLLAC